MPHAVPPAAVAPVRSALLLLCGHGEGAAEVARCPAGLCQTQQWRWVRRTSHWRHASFRAMIRSRCVRDRVVGAFLHPSLLYTYSKTLQSSWSVLDIPLFKWRILAKWNTLIPDGHEEKDALCLSENRDPNLSETCWMNEDWLCAVGEAAFMFSFSEQWIIPPTFGLPLAFHFSFSKYSIYITESVVTQFQCFMQPLFKTRPWSLGNMPKNEYFGHQWHSCSALAVCFPEHCQTC